MNEMGNVKESLLDPADYPEDQRKLVEDFNRKLKNSMGVVTALGKEYHTIWLVNIKDLSLELYRSTGENTVSGLVNMGYRCGEYDRFMETYVDTYVVDRTDSILNEVNSETVMDRIKDGRLYTMDYMRINDEGNISYHQMAFALAGAPGEAEKFILAFRDVDKAIRKHMADKLYLREQLDIVNALSRDYYNIFKIDLRTGKVVILKLDGYVTKGMSGPGDKEYSYDVLYKQYVKDRVYCEDIPDMMEALSLETIARKMEECDEYVSSYRVIDKGEIHYYQFTYIPVNPANKSSGILAGFKNVDDVVEGAKEREVLITLAETDIMTGILNRGSGEQKVRNALMQGRYGLFLIVDVDNFKQINDSFGHSVGDKVIRGIAGILKTDFREKDIVFRLGGDEFAVFAQNVPDQKVGERLVNRVLDDVRHMDISEIGEPGVSVSIGAALIAHGEAYTFEELYDQTDKCVYRSKDVTGNMVTFYNRA